ncbi:hypothetical protein EVAR_95593_1 [Eumeta japonica]|uniref:Uncharacterized protein n=1 Tax=Eumeta variegata TaxID=151549 RepID=A0A4C1VM70_EUMVA|nr:hypothetical protein EVAR_95593_1 [Eumeta japonica]
MSPNAGAPTYVRASGKKPKGVQSFRRVIRSQIGLLYSSGESARTRRRHWLRYLTEIAYMEASSKSYVGSHRPAGRIRPAVRCDPAGEIF